jgi:hypothetical protein
MNSVVKNLQLVQDLFEPLEPMKPLNPDSAVEGETMSEAQAFRSEVNGSLPPREVASTRAMSATVSHLESECRAPKTTLKPYASMPSLLHAHASFTLGLNLTAESGLNCLAMR